jgi:hypothetical protein
LSLPGQNGRAPEHVLMSTLAGPVSAGSPEPTLVVAYTDIKLCFSAPLFNAELYASNGTATGNPSVNPGAARR